MFKILIIDKMHESIHALLNEDKIQIDYQPSIDRTNILQIISGYDGLILRSKTLVDQELLSKGAKLKFVARAGAGIDNVDMDEMEKRNITLINAPEGNKDALAEHCIGILLSLLNNIHRADLEIRAGKWEREANRGVELKGKTVGLIGYGHMGEAFAKRLTSFGCEIIAYDIEKRSFANNEVKEVTFQELANRTEILSIHIPLSKENKGLIEMSYLKPFKKLAYIINTSRGEVLNLNDLVKLLKTNKIKGAALDVLENEKINQLKPDQQRVFNELIRLPQVVLTPHVAGWSFESYERINEVIASKIKSLVEKIKDF